ncbi:MAG: ATP-dependent DNA helicase RecG [Ignavibacteria bacterium]|nr:ATP-dependent DNA helicase RecG [Ignavibacteria bacterium]
MDIKFLKGVGEKRAEAFEKIGITRIEDFLSFIPRDYIERIEIKDVFKYIGENVLVAGEVIDVRLPRKSNQPLTVHLKDNTGATEIPIFGASEFRNKQFRLKDKFIFWGKVSDKFYYGNNRLEYRDHLKFDPYDKYFSDFLKFKFIPLYELSGVLKKTFVKPLLLSKILFNAFRELLSQNANLTTESLPYNILKENNLISRKDAILRINFPHSLEQVEIARQRLAFEEIFYLEIIMALRKSSLHNSVKGIKFEKDFHAIIEEVKKVLSFELTNAQKKVINEIYKDMNSERVMNRLLQGDVGSGKTIVALIAIMIAVDNGYQTAFMCPTEILAEQHYKTVSDFAAKINEGRDKENQIKVSILVGGQKKKLREEILQDIRLGKTHIAIGTHALFQDKVEFNNLGFVVIDEQHKFGVMQRARLKQKGENPDTLVMTATPIPRTLAMTYYGDLDVSIIDEMPKGRIPIITKIRYDDDKQKIFEFVKDKIAEGRQIYIIYPIIEESEKLDLKSAEENFKILKDRFFTGYKVDMIHGRMFWYEKEEVMQNFKDKKIDILVATTVIEVGIDIPNATVMIIEEAQRFGLSQLHQLRGRVGRGAEQSYCVLIARQENNYESEVFLKRLKIMEETTDGFKIAEADMEIRGPGEFFGIRQSGVLNFSSTDLNKDKDIVVKARNIAFKIIDEDPQLRKPEHSMIRKVFMENYEDAIYLMGIA